MAVNNVIVLDWVVEEEKQNARNQIISPFSSCDADCPDNGGCASCLPSTGGGGGGSTEGNCPGYGATR